MQGVLRQTSTPGVINIAIIIFCIVLQSFFTPIVHALEVEGKESADPTLSVPTGGLPASETKRDLSFLFSWNYVADPEAGYQLRISRETSQVGDAPDTSSAWYSAYLTKAWLSADAVSNLGNGIWYWQVRMIDRAGHKGAWSEVWRVGIDDEAPIIDISRPLEGELFGKVAVIPLEVAIHDTTELASISVEYNDQDITAELQRTPQENGVRLQGDLQISNLPDGVHTVQVSATDGSGFSSEMTRSFTVDVHAPEITTSINEGQIVKGTVSLELLANEFGTYAIRIMTGGGELLTQDDTEPQTENTRQHVRVWDTRKVGDGKYTLVFTGRDIAGNESAIERQVTVANTLGVGTINQDPLLEELRTSLSRPLLVPQIADTSSQQPLNPLLESSDSKVQAYDRLLNTVPEFIPVAATENGWRLFGILWYWWMLGGVLLAGGVAYAWRLTRTSIQQLPDSV